MLSKESAQVIGDALVNQLKFFVRDTQANRYDGTVMGDDISQWWDGNLVHAEEYAKEFKHEKLQWWCDHIREGYIGKKPIA